MITYFTVYNHTIFVPWKAIYPECLVLIDPFPQASPLMCMKTDCPANRGCVDVIAKRVNYWFQHIEPQATQMIAYFKYRDRPNSIRAGVFDRKLNEPRVITLNKSGFEKFKREDSVIKQWVPNEIYNNINGVHQLPQIIPVSSLIKK